MIIRTQDKMSLVNLDQVKEIRILPEFTQDKCVAKQLKCEFADGTGRFVGTYSTEERALEVLGVLGTAAMTMYGYCEVFQMPDDKEVSITETDRDLADALNAVENYKSMLFGE